MPDEGRTPMPDMLPVTRSRNVKRYLVSALRVKLLESALDMELFNRRTFYGALTGGQQAEARRILGDGTLIARIVVPTIRLTQK